VKERRISDFLGAYNLRVYRVDISDKKELGKIFEENKIDKICHLAAQAGVQYSIENPSTYIQSNIIGTNNLLELAKDNDIKDFVFASSSSVYGGNTSPF
jgi:UDP-glucuronate 4-epimerase